jgi:hypothetical protein
MALTRPATRGSAHAVEELAGRLSIGEPIAIPLEAADLDSDDAADRDLRLFLESEATTHAYYLVRLACTFRPEAGEPFAQASLGVLLTRADGVPEPKPIAWSMTPRRAEDSVEFSTSVKLEGKASLGGFVDVSGGPQITKKLTRRQIQLAALNELGSNPIWELRKTESGDIDGSYLFALVVRAPRGIPAHAKLALSASIERARLAGRFFTYRALLPDAMQRELVLN